MAKIVTLTSRNQITIPAEIRREMGVHPGDRIIIRSTEYDVYEIKSMSRMSFEDSLELFRIEGPIDWEQLRRDIEDDIVADVMRTVEAWNADVTDQAPDNALAHRPAGNGPGYGAEPGEGRSEFRG